MSNRITTGIPGLDLILEGGFLRHNSVLLKGAPGSGKTSLGIQVLLEGIRQGEPGIICSFEQFPEQLQRDTAAFGWDLAAHIRDKQLAVLFLKPDDLFIRSGQDVPEILSRLHEIADTLGARRLLIDSITHFNRAEPDPIRCRSLLLLFLSEIKQMGLTPLLTAELQSGASAEYSFEEYLVDEALLLHNELVSSGSSLPRRSVEILKTRGHGHARGRHPFDLSSRGIRVFPRLLPEPYAAGEQADMPLEPVSSGVPGVDVLLGGGYVRGGSAVLAGVSGAYKTTLAASFLASGARAGENGIFLTFQEPPQRLVKTLSARGVDLRGAVESGRVSVRHAVPRQTSLEEILAGLVEQTRAENVTRVVIDSMDDFERCAPKDTEVKDYLAMFLAALNRAGATVLFTQKLERLSGSNPISDIRHVSLVDSVVYLGIVEFESSIHKVISALKTRGAAADTDLREIECTPDGLRVLHKFAGLSGILQGSARGQRKETLENIFQPLYFVRDFAQMGAGEDVDDTARRNVLTGILSQINALETALQDHFGIDPEKEKQK